MPNNPKKYYIFAKLPARSSVLILLSVAFSFLTAANKALNATNYRLPVSMGCCTERSELVPCREEKGSLSLYSSFNNKNFSFMQGTMKKEQALKAEIEQVMLDEAVSSEQKKRRVVAATSAWRWEASLPEGFKLEGKPNFNNPSSKKISCTMTLENWIYVSRGITELVRHQTILADIGDLPYTEQGFVTYCLDLGSDIAKICQEFIISKTEGGNDGKKV